MTRNKAEDLLWHLEGLQTASSCDCASFVKTLPILGHLGKDGAGKPIGLNS